MFPLPVSANNSNDLFPSTLFVDPAEELNREFSRFCLNMSVNTDISANLNSNNKNSANNNAFELNDQT